MTYKILVNEVQMWLSSENYIEILPDTPDKVPMTDQLLDDHENLPPWCGPQEH